MWKPKLKRSKTAGVTILEILISLLILLVAILTMVGFTVLIHRSATESRRQAIASVEARSLLERTRDSVMLFDAALSGGYTELTSEALLSGEALAEDNELGNQSSARFRLEARASHLSGEIYSVVVTAIWTEDGRERRVVMESRSLRPE